MKIYSFASALPASLVALFAGTVASVALASPATDALATNLLETHNEIARTGNHVQNAVRALGELTSGDTKDLKAGFTTYSESIRETEGYAKRTVVRAKTMRDNMTTYFAKWYNELDSLSPELKASSEQQLKAVEKKYSQIEEGLSKAAEKFRPIVTELTGIQDTLKTGGLTSSSVDAVSDKSDRTQQEMLSLHEDLKKLLTQILEARQMLSAAGA